MFDCFLVYLAIQTISSRSLYNKCKIIMQKKRKTILLIWLHFYQWWQSIKFLDCVSKTKQKITSTKKFSEFFHFFCFCLTLSVCLLFFFEKSLRGFSLFIYLFFVCKCVVIAYIYETLLCCLQHILSVDRYLRNICKSNMLRCSNLNRIQKTGCI